MKRFYRYLIRVAIALLAFVAGVGLFLFSPNPFSGIGTVPSAAPVAFVPSDFNKGKQCQAGTFYVSERLALADSEVIDPVCARMQLDLVHAAEAGRIDTIRELIAHGANPRASTADETFDIVRPLPAAVSGKQRESVQLLLDNGGDVNDQKSCCALWRSLSMLAIENHDAETVRLLLARGADENFKGWAGETAFDLAVQDGQGEIIRLLDQAGRLTRTQRAEARLARLPGSNIKQVHRVFIRLGLAENILDDPRLRW